MLLRAGVPVASEQRFNGTLTLTAFTGGKPARTTELAPTGTGLLSVRVTRFAKNATDPDVRESWTEDQGGKCSQYSPIGCSGIYYCSCNDGFYYNLDKCVESCSGDLSCAFGSVCGPATAATAATTNGLCP